MSDSLRNAQKALSDQKSEYQKKHEEQQEKVERLKAKVRSDEQNNKPSRALIQFKIQSLKEQLEALDESLFYAKQDVEAYAAKFDLTGKLSEARSIVERLEHDIHDVKKELIEQERLL